MVYEITFRVRTPVITSTPIHFDALLASVHPAMHNLNYLTRRSPAQDVVTPPIPVDSAKCDSDWVFCCSAADYSDDAKPYQTKFTKRKDPGDYFYIRATQAPRTGPGRDRCDTVYGVVCSSIRFFASSQAENELNRISRRVRNIGAMRKMGFGEVTEYQIQPRPDLDWQRCLIDRGVAVRNLPAPLLQSECTRDIICRPPYWVASQMQPGAAAGDAAELRSEVWLNAHR